MLLSKQYLPINLISFDTILLNVKSIKADFPFLYSALPPNATTSLLGVRIDRNGLYCMDFLVLDDCRRASRLYCFPSSKLMLPAIAIFVFLFSMETKLKTKKRTYKQNSVYLNESKLSRKYKIETYQG